jgi:hypothetical protein
MATPGQHPADSRRELSDLSSGGGYACLLLDETLNRGRDLGALATPVINAVYGDSQTDLRRSRHGIEIPDALDKAAVTAVLLIGSDHGV